MSRDEDRSRAASLVYDAIQLQHYVDEPREVIAEVNLILMWLRRRIVGDDASPGLIRALEHETGRQVKPPRGQARAIERLAKGGGK